MEQDIKVVLRNPDGKYITGSAINWGFVEDRCRAKIFDYLSHRVEEQLEFLRRCHGLVLKAEPLPANEVYETCDRCNQLVIPLKTFFDGEKFLCPACRASTEAEQNLKR